MKNILLIVHSYHHGNTMRIAQVFAKKLNATIIEAQKFDADEIAKYDVVGFGSGDDDIKDAEIFAEKIANK